MHDGQSETQGDDRQVGTFQTQRGQAEDKAEKGRDECGDEDGEEKGDLEFGHQQGRPIGADGKKTGMAEGDLAGGAHENVQPHGQDDMDHDDVEKIDVVAGGIKGEGEQEKQQRHRPEQDHPALEELDIFVVIALHVHRVTYNAKRRVGRGSGDPPSQCPGKNAFTFMNREPCLRSLRSSCPGLQALTTFKEDENKLTVFVLDLWMVGCAFPASANTKNR